MLVLSEADVTRVLSMRDAIAAVESALTAQSAGRVDQPLRMMARTPDGILGAMPGAVFGNAPALAAKLVSFFPGNAARGIHTHNAVIAVFAPDTGMPLALVDGRYITEIRTGATSAIATRWLAKQGPSVVAVLGTGVQAHAHIDALREIGAIGELRVWGRDAARAQQLAKWANGQGINAKAAASVEESCHGAEVICTVTSATQAFLHARHVEPGAHINAVGSCTPTMQELAPDLVGKARLIVDTLEGAMREPGDILIAIREGQLPEKPDMVRLCDVVAGKTSGRQSDRDVTIFKSLGMAIEDVACAAVAVERAKSLGLGVEVTL